MNHAGLVRRWRALSPQLCRTRLRRSVELGQAAMAPNDAYDGRRSAVEARYNRQLRTIIVVPACSTVMA